MIVAYLGLGSNLENPTQQVLTATDELAELPNSTLLAASRLYHSKPLGPQNQPDFVNRVVALETTLPPLTLLDHLQELENLHHRLRTTRWGPRTLDLDILLYGSQIINHPRLTIPHPGIGQRDFVRKPLAEIAPELLLD